MDVAAGAFQLSGSLAHARKCLKFITFTPLTDAAADAEAAAQLAGHCGSQAPVLNATEAASGWPLQLHKRQKRKLLLYQLLSLSLPLKAALKSGLRLNGSTVKPLVL